MINNQLFLIFRPRTSTNRKTIRATERRAEQRLVKKAKQGGDKVDELIKEAIKTPSGQKAFPGLARLQVQNDAVNELLVNVKETISSTSKHNKIPVIRSLINGLPMCFSESVLGISKSQRKRANASPSLLEGTGKDTNNQCSPRSMLRTFIERK